MVAANTAKFAGGEYMKVSYQELTNPKPIETRTASEIIASIKSKLGGEQS